MNLACQPCVLGFKDIFVKTTDAGLVEPMSLQKWLLFVPDEMEEADCTDFINKMQKTARKLGCKLAAPVRT